MSLFGEALFATDDPTGAIEEADRDLAQAPDDVDLLIASGRVRKNFWQYPLAGVRKDRGRSGALSADWWLRTVGFENTTRSQHKEETSSNTRQRTRSIGAPKNMLG
jgi:hypothetical protein